MNIHHHYKIKFILFHRLVHELNKEVLKWKPNGKIPLFRQKQSRKFPSGNRNTGWKIISVGYTYIYIYIWKHARVVVMCLHGF